MKEKIAIINPIAFWDTDKTILKHLAKIFHISYYLIFNPNNSKGIESEVVEYCEKENIDLHLCPRFYRLRDVRNIFYYNKIISSINQFKPILVYHCSNEILFNLLIKFHLRCKNVILGIHDVQIHTLNKNLSFFLRKKSRDFSYSLNKQNCVFSKNQAELYKKLKNRDVVNLGMSVKSFGDSSLLPQNIEHGVKLLFFGSILPYKGLDLLIQNLEELFCNGENKISLTIAGRGVFWEECKRYIRHPSRYNCEIRFINNNEIPDLMCSHHFLVLPYRNATQSGPLLTALNYNTPIIAPNFGCFSDTYSNDSGFLYEKNKLQDTLKIVSKISNDDYLSMRNKCTKLKNEYTEEKIAKNYARFFYQLLNK